MKICNKVLGVWILIVFLSGCSGEKYELHKYYKDPLSQAAILMGGTYAGIVDEFNTLGECLETKAEVEKDDAEIGYTNSLFECKNK